jgi:hypothetical protein
VIDALDRSLEAFLRRVVPLEASQVDVVFGAPDKDWSAQRARPAVGMFLHSINPAPSRAAAGVRTLRDSEAIERARDLPIMALRYLITVWVADPSDEHRLLGQILRALASHNSLPERDREPELRGLGGPVTLSLIGEAQRTVFEMWSALGVSPRAALDLTVYVPAGEPVRIDTDTPVERVELDTRDQHEPSRRSIRNRVAGRVDPALSGQRVVGRRGSAVVQESGRFVVAADSIDELRLASDDNPDGDPVVPYTPNPEDSDGHRPGDG